MAISKKRTSAATEAGSTSLPEGFHASPTAPPEKDSAKKTPGTSGRTCLEQFGRFNHYGSWAKMFADLLVGTEGWYSMKCNLTWRLRDTKYSRFYFQLQGSTPRTGGSASGLLPTVVASDGKRSGEIVTGRSKTRPSGETYSSALSDLAKSGLLPTPTVMEDRTRNITERNYQKKKGNLAKAAIMGLLPTPTSQDFKRRGPNSRQQGLSNTENWVNLLPTPVSRDWKGKQASEYKQERGEHTEFVITSLPGLVESRVGKTSRKLNPQFVSEMMGFPISWTLVPFLKASHFR